jgi:hypothetical protein
VAGKKKKFGLLHEKNDCEIEQSTNIYYSGRTYESLTGFYLAHSTTPTRHCCFSWSKRRERVGGVRLTRNSDNSPDRKMTIEGRKTRTMKRKRVRALFFILFY